MRRPKSTTRALALLLSACLLTASCRATTQQSAQIKLPTYKPAPLKPPVEERKDTTLPAKTGAPKALAKDQAAPFNGILIDGHLAAKYKLQKAERDTLRRIIAIDRAAFSQAHKLQEQAFNDLVKKAQRSWWDRNKGVLGFWGGVVVGMGLAILSVYAGTRAASAASK